MKVQVRLIYDAINFLPKLNCNTLVGLIIISQIETFTVSLFYRPPEVESQWRNHRDKTRVQMPEKIFPHLKVKC
jgi:hypothetical protein